MRKFATLKWIFVIVLLITLILNASIVFTVHAEDSDAKQKVVRVGWFDSSFCYYDQHGRRCGIDYEYQHRISAYTGWTYEYVEDSWPNLLQMLMNGEIDLLSDVSYKPERADFMFFPDLPMGTEAYYIYIDAQNSSITAENLSSFNGKRIGVNQGSVQEEFLRDWAERNHISIEIIPMVVDEDESMDMVTRGEIDGFTSIYTFSSEQKVVPVSRVGSSDYYYAVNKNRPDLLAELNMALAGIQDEDPYFNQRMSEERLYNTRTNAYLSPDQEDWIQNHGPVRIGYRDNYLPFCQSDKATGELTGALKDFLVHAENSLRSSEVHFEAIPYDSTEAALDAMKAGEIDCVFPVYLSSYDSDELGVRLTNPAMKTEMHTVMRASDTQGLSRDSTIAFAVGPEKMNIVTFILDNYPLCSIKDFSDDDACYKAVASKDADCVLISNCRISAEEEAIIKYKLVSIPDGESIPLSFAVDKADRSLYFLLNKTVLMTDNEDMDAALASYMQITQKVSFSRFMRDNWYIVVALILAIFILTVFLLLQRLKARRNAEEALKRELKQKEQLQSVMEMAYKDPLTGVKSKHAYKEAEKQMNQRIAEGTVSEFSIVVFDLNNLKLINDSRGHEVGDEYIMDACKQICSCFKHSPVFRIGGDEFTAILEGEDYFNQDELLRRFENQARENLEGDSAVVAFGCSRFDPQKDNSTRMVFGRADALMYEEKTQLKSSDKSALYSGSETTAQNLYSDNLPVINVRRHILIADDIESNREIMGDLLKDDYDIYYASDGIQTMEMLRSHKDEIALLILDLIMPKMKGQDVMAQMQVDEDLMTIPVIVLTVNQEAELECLKLGAMDFIPKPYPNIEIVKARIAKCIELSESRNLIQRTQYDKLTGLFNINYFIRYVNRYDQYDQHAAFDAIACNVNQLYVINEKYGRQFGDLVLRSIGIAINKLARKTGGIGCRKEGDAFLLYIPHQDDYDRLIRKILDDAFGESETAERVSLRFGVYANAHLEPDVEERFVRAETAADSVKEDPGNTCGFYEFS